MSSLHGSEYLFDRGDIHVNCLLVTQTLFGHYMNEVYLYVRISDRSQFAGSELVK